MYRSYHFFSKWINGFVFYFEKKNHTIFYFYLQTFYNYTICHFNTYARCLYNEHLSLYMPSAYNLSFNRYIKIFRWKEDRKPCSFLIFFLSLTSLPDVVTAQANRYICLAIESQIESHAHFLSFFYPYLLSFVPGVVITQANWHLSALPLSPKLFIVFVAANISSTNLRS